MVYLITPYIHVAQMIFCFREVYLIRLLVVENAIYAIVVIYVIAMDRWVVERVQSVVLLLFPVMMCFLGGDRLGLPLVP